MKRFLLVFAATIISFLSIAQKTQKTKNGIEYYFVNDNQGANIRTNDYVIYETQYFDKKGKNPLPEKTQEKTFVRESSIFTVASKGDQLVVIVCEQDALGEHEPYCFKVLYTIIDVISEQQVEAVIQQRIDQNTAEINAVKIQYKKEDIIHYPETGYYLIHTKRLDGKSPSKGQLVNIEYTVLETNEVLVKEKLLGESHKYQFVYDMKEGDEGLLLLSFNDIPIEYRKILFLEKNLPAQSKVKLLSISDYQEEENNVYAPEFIETEPAE